jgi:probable HAF family extracellular repeat protein
MLAMPRVAVAVSLGLVGGLGLAGDRLQATVTYVLVVDEVRDLGTLSGHLSSEATAVNDWGMVAGNSENASGARRAVYWPSPDYAPVNLWHLGGGWSEAWGINNYGVIVGNSRLTSSEESRGFKWTLANGMSDLGIIGTTVGGAGPATFARVTDVNNDDLIVGALGNSFGTSGFLYAGGAVFALVPSYCPNGSVLTARVQAINDAANHTGNVFCQHGPWGAPYFQWFVLATTLLTGGDTGDDAGNALNANNVVAGSTIIAVSGQPRRHAFRWSSSTGQQDIHPPNDTTDNSVARGINDHGLIVGRKYHDTDNAAFAYTTGLKMKTLPGLCSWGSWTSASEAFAVNNAGWIVGKSKTCAGNYHATLWKVRIVVRGYIDGLP